MNMKKINVVLIGVGHDHAPAVYSSVMKQEIFEVVGFAALESERTVFHDRIESYKKYIRYFTVEEALNCSGLDAAIIETEEEYLTKYSIMAIEKGLSVHSDKPGGLNLSEFEKMIDLAKTSKKILHFGYMYRYNPAIIKLIEDVKNGEYGEIFSVEAQMNCLHTDEKRAWLDKFPGGMLFFLGCHLIDLILSIQGEPKEVIPLSTASNINGVTSQDIGMVVFKYENGLSFAKSCAAEVGGFMRRQLVVCGSKKTIEINPLEILDEGGLQHSVIRSTTYQEAQKLNWWNSTEKTDSEMFNRYDNMMRGFAEIVMEKKENTYSYDYELALYKLLLKSCGIKAE